MATLISNLNPDSNTSINSIKNLTTINHIDNMYKAYSICSFILTTKYLFSILRNISPNRVKEDYKNGQQENLVNELTEDQMRRNRIVGNNLENEPIDLLFFYLALIFTSFNYISNKEENEAIILTVVISIYTFSRCFYWICYTKGWQPWRSITFVVGKLCSLISISIILITAFKVDFNLFFK